MDRIKQRIFSVVGRSGAGKTTLVEALIGRYRAQGFRVGVIKHGRHAPWKESPEKDTGRFLRAGSGSTLITDGLGFSFTSEEGVDDPALLAAKFFGECDIVIVEGWKESSLPKLEVIGPSSEAPLYRSGTGNIRFVAARSVPPEDIPSCRVDDIEAVIAAIREHIFN